MTTQRKRAWIWLVALTFVFVLAAGAQDSKKESRLRTVRGIVSDKAENPLANSIVFLKDLRTNAVRSSFAEADGSYKFSGLDPNVDYEVHAEHDDTMSATRTVSSFDSRRDIEVILKLNRKKAPR